MYLTEEDAKKKECRQTGEYISIQYIEGGGKLEFPSCSASKCMFWRWEPQEAWFNRIEEGKKISGMDTQEAADCLPRQGYCGLAGKP